MAAYAKIREAYVSLGLQEGCTLEEVKTSYKQAALRTHPDKNPGNPDATAEFQRVGEAYHLLNKHLGEPGLDYDDEEEDYYDEDELYHYHMPPEYFIYLFERAFGRSRFGFHFARGGRPQSSGAFSPFGHQRPRPPPETPEQYRERLERDRKEQIEAQARRERQAQILKAVREREREEEMQAAERRREKKQEEKKAKAELQRKKAEEAARLQSQKTQKLRSQVFQAARERRTAKVKEGIWEHSVDATGGEVKPGCEEFVKSRPKDLKETLLHIAAKADDLDLVEWLESHGADVEERNSQGFTVLHTALKLGRISIVKHLVETYPPSHSDDLYEIPQGPTLLSLAFESGEPELVWIVLENKLASTEEINKAWTKVTSGKNSSSKQSPEKHSDIIELLKKYGGFTPPATPLNSSHTSKPLQVPTPKSEREKEYRKPVHESVGSSQTPSSSQTAENPQVANNQHQQQSSFRGRVKRGRGRGQGRGRGRGSTR